MVVIIWFCFIWLLIFMLMCERCRKLELILKLWLSSSVLLVRYRFGLVKVMMLVVGVFIGVLVGIVMFMLE